jgi:hypothetical protein
LANTIGAPNSDYPKENQFLTLAHAVYKHL